jgi:nicotinamide phosphoribosyltransferase
MFNTITAVNQQKDNFILASDYYKQSHYKMYPKGLEKMYGYLESRGYSGPALRVKKTKFFGLQAILKKYFVGVVVTQEMVDDADAFLKDGFGYKVFNKKDWQRIVDVHGGKLPIKIRAVPEGSVIPSGNALVSVESTDPELGFLNNFCETILLQVWYPITVCTESMMIKEMMQVYADKCGCEVSPFQLNDFGYRGASSKETAGLGGMAHLVNFMGTDTINGIEYAMKYYGSGVCGFSVPAAEHSTVTMYGKENEAKAYEAFMDAYPEGTLSIVSDSYDHYNAVDNIFGKQLKDRILSRNGKIVVRPDSGDPKEICLWTLRSLWKNFGGTVNKKGFKVLNPHVGIIYGDGINYDSINGILEAVTEDGFSIENVVFGMGGALLQQCNRDTWKFAFKCCAAIIDGKQVDVWKDPVTDTGKRSKRGFLQTYYNTETGEYRTLNQNQEDEVFECEVPLMETVFENGDLVKEYTFDEVRNFDISLYLEKVLCGKSE